MFGGEQGVDNLKMLSDFGYLMSDLDSSHRSIRDQTLGPVLMRTSNELEYQLHRQRRSRWRPRCQPVSCKEASSILRWEAFKARAHPNVGHETELWSLEDGRVDW